MTPLTLEQKQENMRRAQAARWAKQNPTSPPATDDTVKVEAPKKPKPVHVKPPEPVELIPVPIVDLVLQGIKDMPWEEITYDQVTQLLIAFREGNDKAGEWRIKKHEQMEAANHFAPCQTCGRKVDISKSGAFQVRTVRDQFFQMMNVYYCSANCVIAENLKGKERTKPGPQR